MLTWRPVRHAIPAVVTAVVLWPCVDASSGPWTGVEAAHEQRVPVTGARWPHAAHPDMRAPRLLHSMRLAAEGAALCAL